MEVIIFLYNVVLLLLYGIAMVYNFIIYRLKKQPFCLYLSILFLFYIFDNTVIYMTEFLNDFAVRYNTSFMSVPAFKTVIIIVTSFCLTKANNLILKKPISISDYLVLIGLALWDLFIPLLHDGAFMVWLYYLPYQIFTLYLSVSGLLWISKDKKITESISFRKYYVKILQCTFLFSILIVIEDTIVIFNFDVYQNIMVKINNRSLSEDILSIIYAVFFIYHLSKELKTYEFNPQVAMVDYTHDAEILDLVENNHFYQFIKLYNLTTREQDILKYLIEDKNYQEISDILIISVGTVKTHVHNIYQKINVAKRSQLIQKYNEYADNTLQAQL